VNFRKKGVAIADSDLVHHNQTLLLLLLLLMPKCVRAMIFELPELGILGSTPEYR
jgi:hypothetical protein